MGFQPPAGQTEGDRRPFSKRFNGKRLTVLGDQCDQCVDRRRVQAAGLVPYTQQVRVLQVGVGVVHRFAVTSETGKSITTFTVKDT